NTFPSNAPTPTHIYTLSLHDALPISHQHQAEIQDAWKRLAPAGEIPPLAFVPQSTPAVRGIYACSYLVYDDTPHGDTADAYRRRSEEHTSELQSRSDLVCRLLLEKKK